MTSDVHEPEKVETVEQVETDQSVDIEAPEAEVADDVSSDTGATEESTAPATVAPLTPSSPGPLQPAAAATEAQPETVAYGAVGEAE